MFVVRRKNKSKTAYDSEGGNILFDEISSGGHSIYTAEITNMIQKEIPVGQLFTAFGKDVVLKAEFAADKNVCRLSVLEAGVYSHTSGADNCSVVTYKDMKTIVDSYPAGECVDALLCASYKNKGTLTLAPYIYDWKSLSLIPRLLRTMLVGIILAVAAFSFKDSTVKDFLFLVFMMAKDNIGPIVSSLFM